jgi:selenide,water dikinase
MSDIRLTEFSHGGGCGCKISPALLADMLSNMAPGLLPPELLVGSAHADDAAVYRLNDRQAIVVTTDFFMPIVDDPEDFGRIAATNALSDVYAMGARPILALAIVGMPVDRLAPSVIGRILEGGAAACRDAGIPVAGGHSIDSVEPIYGLVALGVVDPDEVKTNAGAQAGDVLLLSKPLGIGLLSAGLKQDRLTPAAYEEMRRWTTTLNKVGERLSRLEGVHALTDVTGFGLAGHLLELCRASSLGATLDGTRLPVIEAALELARDGVATGASGRNWDSYGRAVRLPDGAPDWLPTLLTDPQTSGGLLIACAADSEARVQAEMQALQAMPAWPIGRLDAGEAQLTIDGWPGR